MGEYERALRALEAGDMSALASVHAEAQRRDDRYGQGLVQLRRVR